MGIVNLVEQQKVGVWCITLTLSSVQVHSDTVIESVLLKQFLKEAKRKWAVSLHVWRTIATTSGVSYFRLLSVQYVPWLEVRALWNTIQNKLGYVDRYKASQQLFFKDGFKLSSALLQKWPEREQRSAYARWSQLSRYNPNSTDVRYLQNVSAIAEYIL